MRQNDDTRKNPFMGRDYNAPSNMTRIGSGVEIRAIQTEPRSEADGLPVQDWTSVHVIFFAERGTDTGRLARVRPWRWYSKQIDGQSGGSGTEYGRWIPDFEVLVALDPATITPTVSSHYVWDTRSAEKMFWQILDVVDANGNSLTFPTWVKYQVFGYNTQFDPAVVAIAAGTAGGASASATANDGPATIQATHWSPNDGAVTYTTNVTLTTAGFPFVVDDANCEVLGVMVRNVAGAVTQYLNGVDGVNLTAAAGVVTISGAGTPFAATDTDYFLWLAYQPKAYTLGTDSYRTEEIQPLNHELTQPAFVVNDTDLTDDDTHYAPSVDGIVMDGYKDIQFQFYIVGGRTDVPADVTITVTFQGSNDCLDDAGNRVWTDLQVGYDLGSDSTVVSWTDTGATPGSDYEVDFDNWMGKRIRMVYKCDAHADVATPSVVICTERRKAL